jgi:hypothetical protein
MTRRLRRTAALAATATAAMLALSGCLSFTADMTISSEAKGSGTVSIGLQKEAASLFGLTDLAAFEEGIGQQGSEVGAGDLLTGDCTSSETDTEFVQTCTFTDQEFTSQDDPWVIAKDGESIVFTMQSEAQEGQDELLGDASLGTIDVTVTFPGPITAVSGEGASQTGDTEAVVSAPLSGPFDITITSQSSGGGGLLRTLLIVAGVLLLIIVIAVVVFAVLRGRKGSAAPAAAAAPVADATVADAPVAAAPVADVTVADVTVADVTVADAPVADAPVADAPVADAGDTAEAAAPEAAAPDAAPDAEGDGQPPA